MSTIAKLCRELKLGDEFSTHHGKSLRRCQVVEIVEIASGDRVTLTLRRIKDGKTFQLTCLGSEEVQVYATLYAVEQIQIYEPKVLSVLLLGEVSQSLQVIVLQIREKYGSASPKFVRLTCEQLVQRRELISKYKGRYQVYRKPLLRTDNLPVVAYAGTKSERPGWIVEWKQMANGATHPIVQWCDGTKSFSSEELLEPAIAPLALRRIKAAQAFAAGKQSSQFVELSTNLLSSLLREPTQPSKSPVNPVALAEVGKQIGLVDEFTKCIHDSRVREQIFNWLDVHYPNWRQQQRRTG